MGSGDIGGAGVWLGSVNVGDGFGGSVFGGGGVADRV